VRVLLAFILAFFCPATSHAAFSKFQTYAGPPQIACNLVTGVASVGGPCTSGAACDGVADAAPAFWAFRTWALANQGAINQVVLTIPPGSDCLFSTNAGTVGGQLAGVANTWVAGINNLQVQGTGAILREGAASYWLGGGQLCQNGLTSGSGCSARIQSAIPTDGTVTLTAASLAAGYVSRFAIGDWIMVGGLDTQGQWTFAIGFPPNQTYFEWRQIINVNAGTGVITLDRPLTKTFLSTWPNYNDGSAFQADNGGPATIWKVGSATIPWNTTTEFIGLTFYRSGQVYAHGRNVTYRNVTFPGGSGLGAIPTQNETFTAIGTTWNAVIEVDKLIGTFTLDSSSLTLLQFQSNSTDLFIARNGTTFSSGLQGGGKRSELTDVTINDFRPGSYAYGNTPGPVICTRCNVTSWQNGGIAQDDNPSPYSMTSGVISFPNTAATGSGPSQRWASTIGKTIFYGTNAATGYTSIGIFTVLGVTQDPTNTYVQTDQVGGFPNFVNLGGTRIQFRANGAQQFTSDASTGDASFTAMNIQNGCTALAPMMTCGVRSYAPTSAQGNLGSLTAHGKLVSMTIDVTQAYSGAGSATLNATGQFHNFNVDQSGWTGYDWVPQINLKQAGTRVITSSGTTCNGTGTTGCAGDACLLPTGTACFAPPSTMWMAGGFTPYMGSTLGVGNQPQFAITIRTDQTP
jgi:hypothetical protein